MTSAPIPAGETRLTKKKYTIIMASRPIGRGCTDLQPTPPAARFARRGLYALSRILLATVESPLKMRTSPITKEEPRDGGRRSASGDHWRRGGGDRRGQALGRSWPR